MPNINFLTSNKNIEVPENSSVLRMSLRYDGEVPNRCGGGICGNCVCKIEAGAEYLDHVKTHERRKLGDELIEKGYRLACQAFVTNGDIAISWDEETRKQVIKRKPDKAKSTVSSVK